MTFSVEELEKVIKDESSFGALNWGKTELSLGVFESVQRWGGEGEGEDAGYIVKHEESGRLFRVEGYYASYDGYSWESADLSEVVETTVTVSRYKDVNSDQVYINPTK